MKNFSPNEIRNIALLGHSGEGKTSLAESMLFLAKTIDRLGDVNNGTSTMDYDPEEINRKISISLGVAYAVWKNTKINILDVPGFFDFEGEMVSALHVADAAVIVTSASGSLTVGTERALETCAEKKIPAMIFVNQINKENADYAGTVAAIVAKFGKKIIPVEMPIITGGKMTGYIDVITGKAFNLDGGAEIEIPAALKAELEDYKGRLNEIIAETDEDLMNKFFEGEPFSEEEVRRGLLTAIQNDDLIPLMAGNATTSTGVSNLLDKIIDILPSAAQYKGVSAVENGADTIIKTDESKPFSAQVFKSIADPFVGKLLLFRVFTGKLSSGDGILNANAGKAEKAGTIYLIKGKKQDPTDSISAGDIGALAKLVYTGTGDTLCDAGKPVQYAQIEFPKPVISFAAGAVREGDEEKVIAGLIKMQDEDNTFKVEKNLETGDILISGLGEAQLDIMCKRVKNKFGVEAKLSEPRVPYKETIKKMAEAEGKHKKQSGGAGQYGDVFIRFEPGAADGEFEFVDAIVGGAVPRQFIPAVEKGLREAIKKGVLAEYPVVNLKATLYDGKYHPVDSKEIAFIMAAKLAFQEAMPKASPVFLEPIMKLQIVVPDNFLGDIMGDMNKRRGRILGTDLAGDKQVITVEVPMAEIFRYATDLRSMTQGRGKFTMEFLRYEEIPGQNAAKIIEDAKKRKEAEKK
jgi:elongation factor G